MSDEIYVNIGTTFQQPYQAQQPAIGQQPANVQMTRQAIASAQTPFTYQNRQPSTYRNPVNSQTPYIADAQQPYRHPVNANYPFIANAQTPYPYIANAQQPYIGQARQPSTYQNQGRSPFTYARQGQTPVIYQARSPFTYNSRQPVIYQVTYQHPTTYQARQPAIYRNPVGYRVPYIANAQYTAQQPASKQIPYIANRQTPYEASAQQTNTYIFGQPSTYTYDLTHYTLSGTIALYVAGGYSYYIGFTDGVPMGNPSGLGSSPQSPTHNALYTGSNRIMIWKSGPSYPAMIAANWILMEASPAGPTPWVNAGFTKIKISSPNMSETAFPLATYATGNNSMTFSAPTLAPTTTSFTLKFIK